MFADWEVETEAKARHDWKMDSELSSATLTITPIEVEDGSVIYHLADAVEVLPYPNPLSFGGCWGNCTVDSEAEVKEREKLFLETLSTWDIINDSRLKGHGMTRIKVVWNEKRTRIKNLNARRAARGEEQPLLLT